MTLIVPGDVLRRRPHTLAQSLTLDLSARIRSQGLPTGAKLPSETELMEAYSVSRAVVREAITQLQAARLVETRHGIGTFVLSPPAPGFWEIDPATELTLKDVLAVLELRVSLETEAAALAAQRRSDVQLQGLRIALDHLNACSSAGEPADADAGFHLSIAVAAGNPNFHRVLDHLGTHIIPRARLSLERLTPADLQRVSQEHEEIFSAIARSDADAARAAMRTHLSNSRERLLRSQRIG
ncbi:MAG TPA: FadR/GntR family transcriptional regulator [Burkholderiaceae bacterium]|jgi:GntR family transcriptional repressor for pyruvate dehydrogenase complex